jgi:hypothetical protein
MTILLKALDARGKASFVPALRKTRHHTIRGFNLLAMVDAP